MPIKHTCIQPLDGNVKLVTDEQQIISNQCRKNRATVARVSQSIVLEVPNGLEESKKLEEIFLKTMQHAGLGISKSPRCTV